MGKIYYLHHQLLKPKLKSQRKKSIFFIISLIALLICDAKLIAQNRNSVWCFGDSALIDFNNIANPIVGESIVRSRGSCVSICDSTGNLLFYASTRATLSGFTGQIYDSSDQLMQNGNSIAGQGWFHEMIIIPDPANTDFYYLFSIGVTTSCPPGLFYSTIDMNLNGGLGAVVQKNVQLDTSLTVDCISAVKHGNGRDWWIITRRMDASFNGNKRYYKYLVDPAGINFISSQAIGGINTTNSGNIIFNSTGTKMAFVNARGLIDVMNFNRCTAQLSQIVTLETETPPNYPLYVGAAFSINSNYLYVTNNTYTDSYLFQYDLSSPNPSVNRDTIWVFDDTPQAGGNLKLAPDGKIYLSNAWHNGIQYNYPYQDTMYNYVNMNLSVINEPDLPGPACNFQSYSFSLGGKRTYYGLPNNPDYELGTLAGSFCDTLVSLTELNPPLAILSLYYHSGLEKAFINAQNLKGHVYKLQIYDLLGDIVFNDEGNLHPPYFTKEVLLSLAASGVYVVKLETNKETLTGKLLISK